MNSHEKAVEQETGVSRGSGSADGPRDLQRRHRGVRTQRTSIVPAAIDSDRDVRDFSRDFGVGSTRRRGERRATLDGRSMGHSVRRDDHDGTLRDHRVLCDETRPRFSQARAVAFALVAALVAPSAFAQTFTKNVITSDSTRRNMANTGGANGDA